MGWSTVILCTLLAVLSLGLTDAHNQRRCSATSISYAGKNAYFPQTSCNRVAKWKCPSGKWLERTCICKSGSAPRWSTLRGSCTGSSGCPAQAAMDLSGVTIGQLSAAASGKSCNVRCPSSSTSVKFTCTGSSWIANATCQQAITDCPAGAVADYLGNPVGEIQNLGLQGDVVTLTCQTPYVAADIAFTCQNTQWIPTFQARCDLDPTVCADYWMEGEGCVSECPDGFAPDPAKRCVELVETTSVTSTSVTYENEEDLRQYNQTFYSNALLSGVAVYQTIELPELTGAPCYEYIYHQAIFPTLTTSPVSLAFLCYYLAGGNYTVDLTSYSLYIQAGNPIGVNLYLAFITKKREAGTLPEIGMDGDREEGSLVESEEEILERERRAITFGWAAKTFIRRCRFPPPNC
eukprot:Colp12_sorted_trinity150504_noHs@23161